MSEIKNIYILGISAFYHDSAASIIVDGKIIAAAQEEDGYLYTNRTIDPSKAKDGAGEERWTGLWRYHELYNVGHMYEAAVAHYQATGEHSLLDVAIRNADLIDQVFGPGKNMGVPGHEEIEMGLVKLYRVTGDLKYLKLARFFVDQRGNDEGHELFGEYCQDHKLFADQEFPLNDLPLFFCKSLLLPKSWKHGYGDQPEKKN